jgi:hypothetical protein
VVAWGGESASRAIFEGRVTLIDFKNGGAVITQFRFHRKTIEERLIPENMIDTKAILFWIRAPSPFSPVAMPFTAQVDEAAS